MHVNLRCKRQPACETGKFSFSSSHSYLVEAPWLSCFSHSLEKPLQPEAPTECLLYTPESQTLPAAEVAGGSVPAPDRGHWQPGPDVTATAPGVCKLYTERQS